MMHRRSPEFSCVAGVECTNGTNRSIADLLQDASAADSRSRNSAVRSGQIFFLQKSEAFGQCTGIRAISGTLRKLQRPAGVLVVFAVHKCWGDDHVHPSVDPDQVTVEQRVYVSTEQKSVVGAVGLVAAPRPNVRRFQNRQEFRAGHRALPFPGPNQMRPKGPLTTTYVQCGDDTPAGVHFVKRRAEILFFSQLNIILE